MKLTDAQWAVVEPLIPKPPRRADGKGRPRQDDRAILDGILWIMRTGAQWDELPKRFPPKSTCHDRFQVWNRSGVIASILKSLAEDLVARGELDLSESFVDATFAPAKRGAPALGPRSGVRGPRSWQSRTLEVFLSPYTWRALPRMRRRWLRLRLKPLSLRRRRSGSSASALTRAIHLTRSSAGGT